MYYTCLTQVHKPTRHFCHCWGLLQICALKVYNILSQPRIIYYGLYLHFSVSNYNMSSCAWVWTKPHFEHHRNMTQWGSNSRHLNACLVIFQSDLSNLCACVCARTGDSRCFLFTVFPRLRVYSTTGYNQHFMYLNQNQQTMPNGLVRTLWLLPPYKICGGW